MLNNNVYSNIALLFFTVESSVALMAHYSQTSLALVYSIYMSMGVGSHGVKCKNALMARW